MKTVKCKCPMQNSLAGFLLYWIRRIYQFHIHVDYLVLPRSLSKLGLFHQSACWVLNPIPPLYLNKRKIRWKVVFHFFPTLGQVMLIYFGYWYWPVRLGKQKLPISTIFSIYLQYRVQRLICTLRESTQNNCQSMSIYNACKGFIFTLWLP